MLRLHTGAHPKANSGLLGIDRKILQRKSCSVAEGEKFAGGGNHEFFFKHALCDTACTVLYLTHSVFMPG